MYFNFSIKTSHLCSNLTQKVYAEIIEQCTRNFDFFNKWVKG